MEFKGTKGKWVIFHEEAGYHEFELRTPIVESKTFIKICDVYGDDEQSKANALLISKAPEMLEMLKYLNTRGGLGLGIHNELKQLIKEATELNF